jgi:polyisoprenoid-binding protein YceI
MRFILVIIAALNFSAFLSYADNGYIIDAKESSIICSVKYSLVGTYQAHFQNASGIIYFDPKNLAKSSVMLKIETASLKSRYGTLDRLARSKRLLNAAKYPDVLFKSQQIQRKGNQYYVTGRLSLHGISRTISFPFVLTGPVRDGKKIYLVAKGKWLIDRKKFNVIWDKHLDKGGIVVGDQITVGWSIKAYNAT